MNHQKRVECFRAEHSRHFAMPTVRDAWLFLVTEVAEVGDCLIRAGYGNQVPMPGVKSPMPEYSRADNDKPIDMVKELGDTAVMLCTLATLLGVDLYDAMEKSLQEIAKRW